MKIIINLVLSTLTVIVSAYIIQGVTVDGFLTALVVAVLLGIVNSIIMPIIKLLTLPITVLTLGLFSLVINALMVLLVAWIVPGFMVSGFLPALLFAILLSLINTIIFKIAD